MDTVIQRIRTRLAHSALLVLISTFIVAQFLYASNEVGGVAPLMRGAVLVDGTPVLICEAFQCEDCDLAWDVLESAEFTPTPEFAKLGIREGEEVMVLKTLATHKSRIELYVDQGGLARLDEIEFKWDTNSRSWKLAKLPNPRDRYVPREEVAQIVKHSNAVIRRR